MTEERDDGLTQARRCVDAMAGQDEATRFSLWNAAKRFAARDRDAHSRREGHCASLLTARGGGAL
jgi:hypothetical protein